MSPKLSDAHKNVLNLCLIAVVAALIYSNSFQTSFHFDDVHSIIENYAIHRFDVRGILSASPRPVLDLTFALNYYFGKLDVFGYHLVNLILHIANGILLYFILLWTLHPAKNGQKRDGQTDFRVPLYAGLLFIAHPLQTQAVTYIVSRSSVMATTFYLLALLLFIGAYRYSRPLPFLAGAFVASCLGMGTKQETATLPLMLVIYDYYFISDGALKTVKRHYKAHLAMWATLAVVLYINFHGINEFVSFDSAKGVKMPQGDAITSFQYFLTQLHVIPYYIKLLFLPINLNLDYDWPITRQIDLPTVLYFFLLAAIIALAVKLFRKERLISFGIIWFFVTLSVTSSFLVIYDMIFEHRLYLPSIGFVAIIAVLISKISGLRSREKVNQARS